MSGTKGEPRQRLEVERLASALAEIHTTGHTDASHLVQRGVPLMIVAKLLGQSVLTVTANRWNR